VKGHIFHFFMAGLFTYQSFYFSISDFSSNYNHKWSLPKRHLSCSIRVGKSVTSTLWPVITCVGLCGNGMQACMTLCTIGILSNKGGWSLVVVYTATVCGITTRCLNGHSVSYMECSVLLLFKTIYMKCLTHKG